MAWQELGSTIYNYSEILNIRGHYVITRRPSLNIQIWVNIINEILVSDFVEPIFVEKEDI